MPITLISSLLYATFIENECYMSPVMLLYYATLGSHHHEPCMSSLRGKIYTTYGFSKGVLLVFAVVVFVDLNYLRTQIEAGESVNTFREASQDMRRVEKNLFLYHEVENLDQLLMHVDAAETALKEGLHAFEIISSRGELIRADELLRLYREQMEAYPLNAKGAHPAQQQAIRNTGQELSALADHFSRRERAILAQAVRTSGMTLVVAFLVVLLLGVAGALFLARLVARPLRELETQLDRLADGKAQHLTLPSNDKEIRSFVNHANGMLERLRWQQNQLRHQEKAAALGVLVSGVAHELNNPLSNISTSVQLLMEEGAQADAALHQRWLTHIDSETERSRRIVRRLLDSVRQPKLHMQAHNVAELMHASLALVKRQLPPGVKVDVRATPERALWADRERIQQVFINLIKNAADARATQITISAKETTWLASMPRNTDNVEGEVDYVSKAGSVLLIQFDDNGPGIAPEHLAQIFNPFFTTHSAGDGTGLGLYLVEEIICEHHGCITAENIDKGGTRFSIWLPLTHEQEST